MDPRDPATGHIIGTGLASETIRSDAAAAFQSGLFRGFIYGALFMTAVLFAVSAYAAVERVNQAYQMERV